MERSSAISLLRQIYRELRRTRSMGQKYVWDSKHWKYIVSTAKDSKNLQPSDNEAKQLSAKANSYLEYLRSSREYAELLEKYKGKGERSPDDLAKILGFRMPNEPKEPRKGRSEKENH